MLLVTEKREPYQREKLSASSTVHNPGSPRREDGGGKLLWPVIAILFGKLEEEDYKEGAP